MRTGENYTLVTGNTEIDALLGGGLPGGSLVLVEGASRVGKSVLMQQMVYGALWKDVKASFFSTEHTVKGFTRQMQSLGLDVLGFVLLRRLRIYPMDEGMYLRHNALEILLAAMKQEQELGSVIVFVDALTPYTLGNPLSNIQSFFANCWQLSSYGLTVVVTLHSHLVEKDLLACALSLCDVYMRLQVDTVGGAVASTIEMVKAIEAQDVVGHKVRFEVVPGFGLRTVPI